MQMFCGEETHSSVVSKQIVLMHFKIVLMPIVVVEVVYYFCSFDCHLNSSLVYGLN